MQFNQATAQKITDQIREILTGHDYEFVSVNYTYPSLGGTRVSKLDPDDATSGDALNLSLDTFALLTVVDTYGVWQISEGDDVTISENKIVISKSDPKIDWTITVH